MRQGHGVRIELERIGEGERDRKHGHVVRVREAAEQVGQPNERREELQHGQGDHLRRRDLGEVEQHLLDQMIHPFFHLQGACGQSDDADAVAVPGEESHVEGVDQGLLDRRVQALVVRGHGRQDREHLVVEFRPAEVGWRVHKDLGVAARSEINKLWPIPNNYPSFFLLLSLC